MLHLLKLCVGCDSIDQLRQWIDGRAARGEAIEHRTRNYPRRADEILAGGSLYWVIRGQIAVRQRIMTLSPGIEDGGQRFCRIGLDRTLVRTLAMPHRPLQGWRYLEAPSAPADAGSGDGGSDTLASELRGLGLL